MGKICISQSVLAYFLKTPTASFLWVVFVLLRIESGTYSKVICANEYHVIADHKTAAILQGLPFYVPHFYIISSSFNKYHKAFLPDDGFALCWFPSKRQIFCFSFFRNHITCKHHIPLPESHIQPWLWNVLFVRGP
jgi:hypothetical protein